MADTFRWSGFAHAIRDGALIHIQNTETADVRRLFTLTSWDVRPWVGSTDATGLVGAWRLRYITAHSGGEVLSSIAADPSVPALPSQVTALIQSTVTVDSTTSSLRDRASLAISTANISWPQFGRLVPGGASTSNLFESMDSAGALQRITLPAGKGIALIAATDTTPVGPETWYATLTLRDETNGRTYFVQGEAVGAGSVNNAIISVMNAAGSGITLSVANIDIVYGGEPSTTAAFPSVRLMRTIGGNDQGEVITPLSLNPSIAAPSALVIRRGRLTNAEEPRVAAPGLNKDDLGYPANNIALWQRVGNLGRRLVGQGTPNALSQASYNAWAKPGEPQYGQRFSNTITGVVLRPQTGVALVLEQPSMYSTYWVEIEITHTPPPPGGGNTYSRARVVNI